MRLLRSRGQKLYTSLSETYTQFIMALSSTQRALIAVAAMIGLAGAAVGVYYYRQHQPLPGASAGQPPDLLGLIPADAPAIAYVDLATLRGLQNSPLAAVLGLTSPGPEADREYSQFVRDTGFDYTRDLDTAAIGLWPNGLISPRGGPPSGRVLAIANGRFDQKKIGEYALQSGRVRKTSPPVYEFPGQSPAEGIFLAFLSSDRIALTNDSALLDQLASAPAHTRDPAMQSRIERVAGAPIFAVARTDHLPSDFYESFKGAPQLEHLIRSVRSVTLAGKPSNDEIKVALDGDCDSMNSAFQIATLLNGFRMIGSAALADPRTRRQMTRSQAVFLDALLRQVKVDHQDHWVRLTLDITPAMLGAPVAASSSRSSSR
jgi:hypothetical protein